MWIDAGARVCCYLAPISSLIYVSVYLFLRAPLLVGRAAARNLYLSLSRSRCESCERSGIGRERAARGEKIGSSLDFVANAGVNKFTCSADADVGGPFRLWCWCVWVNARVERARGQRSFTQLPRRHERSSFLSEARGVQFPNLIIYELLI
jgi:hypothetical protein